MFVFGMDLPLPEMLFTAFFIILIAIGFVLYEIIKLRRILSQETSDIKRFEQDLALLEQHGPGSGANNKAVVNFIKTSTERGITKEQVQSTLASRGWKNAEIEKVFKQVESEFSK
ncbi:MAG: hypothetical protein QXK37_03095 [Candidatus Woesearchaeota archaeon]